MTATHESDTNVNIDDKCVVLPLKRPEDNTNDATQVAPNQEDDKATGRGNACCVEGGSGPLLCDHCDEAAAFQCDTCGIIYCGTHDAKNHQGVLSHHKRTRIVPGAGLRARNSAPTQVAGPATETVAATAAPDAVDSFLAASADLEAAIKVSPLDDDTPLVVIDESTPETAPVPTRVDASRESPSSQPEAETASPQAESTDPNPSSAIPSTAPPPPPAPAVPPQPASASTSSRSQSARRGLSESRGSCGVVGEKCGTGSDLPSSSHEFEAFLEKKRRRQKTLMESMSSQSAARSASVASRADSEARTADAPPVLPPAAAVAVPPEAPVAMASYHVGIPPTGVNPISGMPHMAQQGAVPFCAVDRSAAVTVRRQMLAAMKQTLDWAEGPTGRAGTPHPMATAVVPPCPLAPVLSPTRVVHQQHSMVGAPPSTATSMPQPQEAPQPVASQASTPAQVFDPSAAAVAPLTSTTTSPIATVPTVMPSPSGAESDAKDDLADLKRGTEASLSAIEARLGKMENGPTMAIPPTINTAMAATIVAPPSPAQADAPLVDSLPPNHPLAADRWAALEADATRFQAQMRQLEKEKGGLQDTLRHRDKVDKAKAAEHESALAALREEVSSLKEETDATKETVAQCTQHKTELMLSLEQERSLRLKTELELAAAIEKERAAKLEAEAKLLEAQENQQEAANIGIETASTLQKTLQQLADLEHKYQATLDAHGAVERLNQALTGRVASLERVLTAHAASHDQATKPQEAPLFPTAMATSAPGPTVTEPAPVMTVPSVDGASLRSKVAERIERGDLKAEEVTDEAAQVEEIKKSKYPLNFNVRLAEAGGEGSGTTDSPGTVQRKQEREERLAAITMSWDTQMNAAHKDDDERRAQLMAMAEHASLAKHMESMQDVINQNVNASTTGA